MDSRLKMKHFGPEDWGENKFGELIKTPIEEKCIYCEESIAIEDFGVVLPIIMDFAKIVYGAEHRECFLRSIFGSVAHQQGKCSCYGNDCEDDPNLTKRQAAKAAVAFHYRN